jgi:uncharacterized protein (TIGR00369 family)
MRERIGTAISPLDEALGMRLVEVHDDHVVLRLDASRTALGGEDPRPYLHGGALATCVDTAGWAAIEAVSPGGGWVAIDLRCDFVRLAGLEPHRVIGRCLRAGRTLALADVVVEPWDAPGRLVATGRAQFMRTGA